MKKVESSEEAGRELEAGLEDQLMQPERFYPGTGGIANEDF